MAADYLMLFVVPATLGYMIREKLRGREDEEDEDYWTRMAMENLSYLAGTMLGVREVASAIAGYTGYEGPSGARAFAALGRLGKQAEQGELDEALIRSINDVAGLILHFPSGQSWRTYQGIAAIAEGKTYNPLAVLVGPPKEK